MRSYFGSALRNNDTDPSIFASPEEALSHLIEPETGEAPTQ